LINELTWGINKAHQQNSATDTAAYNASLLPLKGANGQPLTLPTIFGNGVNTMNLMPNVNFGLPSGFSAQSAPTPIPNIPAFGFDSRWPFDGTDSIQNVTENITWVKATHSVKAGFYFEHDARNVSVYSTYNTAGTYFFGSDLSNPVDTGNPFANALVGSLYGYGQDNIKQINHARYKQYEWFVQDTWRVTRRFTLDYGLRFQILGPVYSSGATLGIFDASAYSSTQVGQLLYPALQNGARVAINPKTGAVYPYVRQGTFDPASYSAGSLPYSGIKQYQTNLFNTPVYR
jgi:outer membrane receptor protein involved in Fe transport